VAFCDNLRHSSPMSKRTISLSDTLGRKKYLSEVDSRQFLQSLWQLAPQPRTYCLTLFYTGARRSEALAIRKCDVSRKEGEITLFTLKKRRRKPDEPPERPARHVPVPGHLIDALDMAFDLKRGKREERLWKVTSRQANRWIDEAMRIAGLEHHTPKSLRHTFGVTCVTKGVPLSIVKDLMGHEDIDTTTIYATPLGAEKRDLVRRMWE
jgi:integrase/recombinase XerD